MSDAAEWTELCEFESIADGRSLGIEHEGRLIAVFRDGATVAVVSGQCPHAGGLMSRGWVEEGHAVCPLHRWYFRLRDGRCATIRGEWIRTYPSEIRDGRVFARL